MPNRGGMAILTIFLLGLSIWGVSAVLTIRDERLQYVIVGICLALFLLLTVKPRYPLDFKLLIFAIWGYFIGAKGFAYLSPAPPLYIGEITLAVCMVGAVLREGFHPTRILNQHVLINLCLVLLVLCSVRLYFDYRIYSLYAIRDFAMIYYSLFMLLAVFLLKDPKLRKVFKKAILWAMMIGSVVAVIAGLGLGDMIQTASLGFIWPHPDVTGPLLTAVAVYFIFQYKLSKHVIWLMLAIILTGFLVMQKSAYPFCFVLTCCFLIIFARMYILVLLGVVAVLFVAIALPLDIMFQTNWLTGSDIANTISDGTKASAYAEDATDSTSSWRLAWWKMVYEETMRTNSVFGLGFGADITTPFLKDVYGVEIDPQRHGYARYPHNIFFTVLGRLGWLGVSGLLLYCGVFLVTMAKIAKWMWRCKAAALEYALLAFVFAGFCNAFVQATYEVPYAAIAHWCVLGYLLIYYKSKRRVHDVVNS